MPDEAKPSQFKPLPTVWNLRELVERCLDEARKSGFIIVSQGTPVSEIPRDVKVEGKMQEFIQAQVIADERKLAEHIALTIIGELRELEVLRKVAPMFRAFRQIENDLNELDVVAVEEFKLRNLRRVPQEGDLK